MRKLRSTLCGLLAADVVDVRRVRAVGVETVEALVLAVRHELVFSVAEEAVDIGRAAPLEVDRVETREVGHDEVEVPPFPSFVRRNGQPRTCRS
jgi:hypothetical protein